MLHFAASDFGLHCLPISHKKNARLIWVKNTSSNNLDPDKCLRKRTYKVRIFRYQIYHARLQECVLNHFAQGTMKPSLLNLISKDVKLIFYISGHQLIHSSNYNLFFTLIQHYSKSAMSCLPDKDRQRLSGQCATMQLI